MKEPFSRFIEANLGPKTLLITTGLPGTWKTETSEETSKIKGYYILRSDIIRLEVLKNEDVFDTKVAGNMNKRLSVYDEVFRRADDLAQKGSKGIILDATFVTLQTSCPEEVSVARIQRRTKENYESNALTVDAYLANKKKFEPVDIADLKKKYPTLKILHLTVDTCHDNREDWYVIGMENA